MSNNKKLIIVLIIIGLFAAIILCITVINGYNINIQQEPENLLRILEDTLIINNN